MRWWCPWAGRALRSAAWGRLPCIRRRSLCICLGAAAYTDTQAHESPRAALLPHTRALTHAHLMSNCAHLQVRRLPPGGSRWPVPDRLHPAQRCNQVRACARDVCVCVCAHFCACVWWVGLSGCPRSRRGVCGVGHRRAAAACSKADSCTREASAVRAWVHPSRRQLRPGQGGRGSWHGSHV